MLPCKDCFRCKSRCVRTCALHLPALKRTACACYSSSNPRVNRAHPIAQQSPVSCAADFTAVDVYNDLAALRTKRADAFAHIEKAGADYLVVPTVMHHYLASEVAQQEADQPKKATYNAYLGTFTNFVNLLGMCALSVPAGVLPDVELEVCCCVTRSSVMVAGLTCRLAKGCLLQRDARLPRRACVHVCVSPATCSVVAHRAPHDAWHWDVCQCKNLCDASDGISFTLWLDHRPGVQGDDKPLKLAFGITIIGRGGQDEALWKLGQRFEAALEAQAQS